MGCDNSSDNRPVGTTESLQKEQMSSDAAAPENTQLLPEAEVEGGVSDDEDFSKHVEQHEEGQSPAPVDPIAGIIWDVLPVSEHSFNASWESVSLSSQRNYRIRVWQVYRPLGGKLKGMLGVKREEFFPIVPWEQSMVITRWTKGTDGILPAGELFHVALE